MRPFIERDRVREGGFDMKTNNPSSYFAPFLLEMAKIKHNSGFILREMNAHIPEFDTFCTEKYPDKRQLDRELVEAWIYSTNSKCRKTLINRIQTMKHLANHSKRLIKSLTNYA